MGENEFSDVIGSQSLSLSSSFLSSLILTPGYYEIILARADREPVIYFQRKTKSPPDVETERVRGGIGILEVLSNIPQLDESSGNGST